LFGDINGLDKRRHNNLSDLPSSALQKMFLGLVRCLIDGRIFGNLSLISLSAAMTSQQICISSQDGSISLLDLKFDAFGGR